MKSRLVLKDYNRSQRRTQPEMFSPTPSTLSLKTMLAASSHDRNNDPESNHITVSIDVRTAFLHADVDQDFFAEPPEPDEWYDAGLKEDEVSKSEVLKLVELLSKQVLMKITGRMEKTGDKIYFLVRVIERTARRYSVEANPKYIRNVFFVLGLEEARPVMTPSDRVTR